MAMLGQFLCDPWNFEIFNDRLGLGLRDDFTPLTLTEFQLFGGMMHSTVKQITIKNSHDLTIFACSTEL